MRTILQYSNLIIFEKQIDDAKPITTQVQNFEIQVLVDRDTLRFHSRRTLRELDR